MRGLWQYTSYGVWRVLHKTNIPYFVYPHGMLDPWFKYQYPLKHLKKWLYWILAEYRVLRDARAVLFTSCEERIRSRQSFWLYHCTEETVNYGIPDPTLTFQLPTSSEVALGNTSHQIIFLGRLHPKKGCDILIQAWAEVFGNDPHWHLVMVGPDQESWQAHLQKLTIKLGIADSVSWPGMLVGKDKINILQQSEALILPSHQENFGIVVAESLACGIPVLLSQQVNIWQEVINSLAGFAAKDTIEGVIWLLKKWRDIPDYKKQEMRQNARVCYLETFTMQSAIDSFLEILKKYKVEK